MQEMRHLVRVFMVLSIMAFQTDCAGQANLCSGKSIESDLPGGYHESRCFVENGGAIVEQSYLLRYPNGKYSVSRIRINESCSYVVTYYASGIKKEKGIQCNGVKIGVWRCWDKSGRTCQ